MATKEEVAAKVLAALKKKIGTLKPCPLCGTTSWLFPVKFVRLDATKNPQQRPTTEGFPLAPLICQNCGNTHLLNLLILGFSSEELAGLALDDEPR